MTILLALLIACIDQTAATYPESAIDWWLFVFVPVLVTAAVANTAILVFSIKDGNSYKTLTVAAELICATLILASYFVWKALV